MDIFLLVQSAKLQNNVKERSMNHQHCLRDPAVSARFLHHLEADNTEGIQNNRLPSSQVLKQLCQALNTLNFLTQTKTFSSTIKTAVYVGVSSVNTNIKFSYSSAIGLRLASKAHLKWRKVFSFNSFYVWGGVGGKKGEKNPQTTFILPHLSKFHPKMTANHP